MPTPVSAARKTALIDLYGLASLLRKQAEQIRDNPPTPAKVAEALEAVAAGFDIVREMASPCEDCGAQPVEPASVAGISVTQPAALPVATDADVAGV